MKVYVEKTVAGYPMSLVGPFTSRTQAELFIERALVEERNYQPARDAQQMSWYTNPRYRIIAQEQIDT